MKDSYLRSESKLAKVTKYAAVPSAQQFLRARRAAHSIGLEQKEGTFSAALANISYQKSVDENVRNSFRKQSEGDAGTRQRVF